LTETNQTSFSDLHAGIIMTVLMNLKRRLKQTQPNCSFHLLKTSHLDNGCDELLNKIVPQEVGPEMVDKVDQQPLDVGPVLILIGHDHQATVS